MSHFDESHPVAQVARNLCKRHCAYRLSSPQLIARVACGRHWEEAIRTDERIAVEYDLPPVQQDPLLIDDVAVEARMNGRHVQLTRVEQRVAVLRLSRTGMCPTAIGRRIGLALSVVKAIIEAAARADDQILAVATAFYLESNGSHLAAVA